MLRTIASVIVLFGCGDSASTAVDGGSADMTLSKELPIGAACDDDAECVGGDSAVCFSDGYPDGYCSLEGCSVKEQDCPGGKEVAICREGSDGNYCFDRCLTFASDCRDDYLCVNLDSSTSICLPPNFDADIGDPCELDVDCSTDQFCLSETAYDFPEGSCSQLCNPAMTNTCPPNASCFPTGTGPSYCLPDCDSEEDCRDDYDCQPYADGGDTDICFPD